MKIAMMAVLLVASIASAHAPALEDFHSKPILADLMDLRALEIPVLAKDEYAGVGYAVVTPFMQAQIQERAHQVGKCGGFEDLSLEQSLHPAGLLQRLAELKRQDAGYERAPFRAVSMDRNPAVEAAINQVSESNLQATVQWLSSYPNRYNRAKDPNVHVREMKSRLEAMMASAKIPWEISLIDHQSTKQQSIRVRLVGTTKPNEIVVLGGHLDSINASWFEGDEAPGADDNASGSANLVEALRIFSKQTQPQRTVEFFWYAGEESGLLGSAEIAKSYKNANVQVIAVLQLDMTMFPGSGEFVIANMTDYTSSWLREYLRAMNETYLHVRLVEDQCGYGCSDHASWYRQGFPTVVPFESMMSRMNSNIHSKKDVITPESNFKHSAMYSRIALVFAMDLGNSNARQPY